MRSSGKLRGTAFVTGASTGLGLAFTRMLLGEGVRVWGTSREPARLGEVAGSHPGAFFPVLLDLGDAPGALRAYRAAESAAGGAFDLVVSNAGFGVFGEFDAVPVGKWSAQLSAMLVSTVELSHAAYASMRLRNRGCLVHVSSLAAEFPIPYMSGYNVAKAGLSALSESLMFESRRSEIRVIDFRPGDYRTQFNQSMHKDPISEGCQRAWTAIDALFESAPEPELAALDLRRALLADRSGVVRSGSFFQSRLAPLLARLMPDSWVRRVNARYYGL